MTIAIEQRATPEDLLQSKDRGRFELVGGELVEKPQMSKESNRIGGEVLFVLKLYLRQNPIAAVYPEQEFMCFGLPGDPTRIRKADVAVVLACHVSHDAANLSYFYVRPDIAIEVISPDEGAMARSKKLQDYEAAGVPLVWVLEPELREVQVRPADGPIRVLRASDFLTAEPILPGFSVRVADLFPPAVEPAAAT